MEKFWLANLRYWFQLVCLGFDNLSCLFVFDVPSDTFGVLVEVVAEESGFFLSKNLPTPTVLCWAFIVSVVVSWDAVHVYSFIFPVSCSSRPALFGPKIIECKTNI